MPLDISRYVPINLPYLGVSINGDLPQNRWFIREHPINMDDLGVTPFHETVTWVYCTSGFCAVDFLANGLKELIAAEAQLAPMISYVQITLIHMI